MDVLEKHDAKKHCLDSEVALQPPIPLHTMGQRRYFWIPSLKHTIPKNIVWILFFFFLFPFRRTSSQRTLSRVAPQTRIPLHTLGQKRCFWIPKMVVFETHHATKYALGSGVAPQTRISLHTMGQKKCFCVPKMVVFETHHAKKNCVGSGVALQQPIALYPVGQKRCFCIPSMGVFETHNAKKWCLGSGVAPQAPIPLYPTGQQRCFWVPRMGVFAMHNTKKWCLGSGVALQTPYVYRSVTRYPAGIDRGPRALKIGRASCRERV